MIYRNITSLALLASLFVGALLLSSTSNVHAVTKNDWRAGNIVSDSIFYDNSSMSVNDIQSFLNSKNTSCDTWGTQPASEFGRPDISRARYAQLANWHSPPYICLKDYYQVPRSDTIVDNYNTSATRPAGSLSAAQIIKNAADTYGVSPKSLLVLLQKESAGPLPIDKWPLKSQYKNAMGYACPDTAPCDPQYAGFYNQVMNAAKRIQTYKTYPKSYRHQPFSWNSQVYYNPNLNGCGWSSVYIEGYATAGLYNYTPYQPNKAALDNLYGSGDSCSAYGNRNFWRIFNDWFGSTEGVKWSSLQDPRIMVSNKNTNKIDPITNKAVQSIPAGLEIKFETKSDDCLRTKHDSDRNNNACIKISDLSEFTPVVSPINSSSDTEYRSIDQYTCKVDLIRDNVTNPCLDKGPVVSFSKKSSSQGTDYLITTHDSIRGNDIGFRKDRLSDPITLTWEPLKDPRVMQVTSNVYSINPYNGDKVKDIAAGTQVKFTSKSNDCLRTESNTNGSVDECIKIDSLSEIKPSITNISDNGSVVSKTSTQHTCKVDYMKYTLADGCIKSGTTKKFVKQTTVMGVRYLISSDDYNNNTYAYRADRFN